LIVVLAVVFLVFHLPYLPSSLEDLDSINFALGLRQFDVSRHQPHPPGYPLFILAGQAFHAVVPSEATALALVSVIAGTLGVLAMGGVFRRLDPEDGSVAWPVAAIGVAMTAPLYWFTAVRPLSDVSGLAAALAVQAMTLGAASGRSLAVASFAAGVAAGLRSQVAWLTVPLLIMRGLGTGGWGLGGRRVPSPQSPSPQSLSPESPSPQCPSPLFVVPVVVAFTAGILIWFVPLVIISGGPNVYWRALSNQGAEDLGNIQMLWTTHNARAVVDALYYAFVAPWASWQVAAVVLVFAVLGIGRLYGRARPALLVLAVAFGPYLAFDLLFQETFTSRYALPLIIPIAYLGVAGMRVVPWDIGLALAVAIAMRDAHIGGTSIAAYAREKAPAFRLLDDMRTAAAATREPPVVAMDRRESFDFRRPIAWAGDTMPAIARTLPAPPQHEWLEAVNYWNGGGRAPVWFVVDPMRTSIDLVQHASPSQYRWPLPYPVLISGARPNEMDWYRVDRPEWYVGEGWALTPEAAGVADTDQRDLAHMAIRGWVSRAAALGGVLMVGGRNFDPATHPRLIVALGDETRDEVVLAPGPFLRFVDIQFFTIRDGPRGSDYLPVTISTSPPSRVAIEQFDASSTRPLLGFGDGWHEQEFNPRTGLRWRWLSERGEIKLAARARRLALHIEGESPGKYFSRGSRLVIRSRDQVVVDRVLTDDFSLDVPIADPGDAIVLETDQVYVPADRSRRTHDRRHLGLRIFKCELRPAV
jgi:hypothetical protein